MSPSQIHDREINPCPPHLKISKVSHLPMKKSSHSATSSSSSSSSSSSASSSSSPSPPQSSICSSSASTVMGGPTVMTGPRGRPVASRPPPAYQPRQQPVIIYTHSPKVIHTHPRDFMALVQKLTGLYRPDGDDQEPESPARPKPDGSDCGFNPNNTIDGNNDAIESTSVITEEKGSTCCSNNVGDRGMQMMNPNPNFVPQISYEPSNNPYMNSFSMFDPNNSTDFVCPNQSNFYTSYGDRLLFAPQDDDTQFHQMPLWR